MPGLATCGHRPEARGARGINAHTITPPRPGFQLVPHLYRITVTSAQQVCRVGQHVSQPESDYAYGVAREADCRGCSSRCDARVLRRLSVATAPITAADPGAEPAADAAAPADGSVPSAEPVTFNTDDGWALSLGAKDESQVPVAPLTTAVSSREYLARGTFVASLKEPEEPRGVLEVGYEIGCGIDMSSSNGVTMADGRVTAALTKLRDLLGPTSVPVEVETVGIPRRCARRRDR
jgi:MspA